MVGIVTISKPFFNFRGELLENPTYNPSNDSLLWIDITAKELHRVFLRDPFGTHQVFKSNEIVGALYLTTDENIVLLGQETGIFQYDMNKECSVLRFPFPESYQDLQLKSNDGCLDPDGNIWQGLMAQSDNVPTLEGRVVRVDRRTGIIEDKITNVFNTNGMHWAFDGSYCLWASSLDFRIYKFDWINGELTNRSIFVDVKELLDSKDIGGAGAEPDGLTMTESGHVFAAVWSRYIVLHLSPTGQLLEIISIPSTKLITCCGFGGVDMDELFISTADLKEEHGPLLQSGNDLGGAMYRIKLPGHRGMVKDKFPL